MYIRPVEVVLTSTSAGAALFTRLHYTTSTTTTTRPRDMGIWNNNTVTDANDAVEIVMRDEEKGKNVEETFKETASEAPYVYVPGTEEERKLVRKIDLRLFPMLWVMFCMNYLDRTNIGVSTGARLAH